MGEQPFSNREIKEYFHRFDDKLNTVISSLDKQERATQERFKTIEKDIVVLKIRTENIGVKVAAGVFFATVIVSVFINKFFV